MDEDEEEEGALPSAPSPPAPSPPAPSPLPDIAVMSRKKDGESGGSMDGDVEDCESVGSYNVSTTYIDSNSNSAVNLNYNSLFIYIDVSDIDTWLGPTILS